MSASEEAIFAFVDNHRRSGSRWRSVHGKVRAAIAAFPLAQPISRFVLATEDKISEGMYIRNGIFVLAADHIGADNCLEPASMRMFRVFADATIKSIATTASWNAIGNTLRDKHYLSLLPKIEEDGWPLGKKRLDKIVESFGEQIDEKIWPVWETLPDPITDGNAWLNYSFSRNMCITATLAEMAFGTRWKTMRLLPLLRLFTGTFPFLDRDNNFGVICR